MRSLIEAFIDAVRYCFGITRMKNAKRLKDAKEFYAFMNNRKNSRRSRNISRAASI